MGGRGREGEGASDWEGRVRELGIGREGARDWEGRVREQGIGREGEGGREGGGRS